MLKGFENYNGRYLGNLLAIVISRSPFARMVIMAAGFCLLGIALYRLLPQTESFYTRACQKVLCLAGILLMPAVLYEQSLGWSAAYVNFLPPVLLQLLWFGFAGRDMLSEAAKTERHYGWGYSAGIFSLTFCSQLFSEHNTLGFLLLVAAVVIISHLKKKKRSFSRLEIASSVGAIGGAVLMFSNGAYRKSLVTTGEFKKISFSVESIREKLHETFFEFVFFQPWYVHIILCVGLLLLAVVYLSRKKQHKIQIFVLSMLLISGAGYITWQHFTGKWFFFGNTSINNILTSAVLLVYFCAVACLLMGVSEGKERIQNLLIWLMIPGYSFPLLMASPIGARCFFVTYVLEVLLTLSLLFQAMQGISEQMTGGRNSACRQFALLICCALLVLPCFFYMRTFAVIGSAVRDRYQRIEQAVFENAEEIRLPYLPFSKFYWTTEVEEENGFMKDFKYFHHIPKTTKVFFG